MSRRKEYDKDIEEMYGVADPSILFEVSDDLRIARAMGFSFAYYPRGLSIVQRLFANNESGAVYDPSQIEQYATDGVVTDWSKVNLFQDIKGTTPVLFPGDPVGLLLDSRKGLERGPDAWTADSAITVVAPASYDAATQTVTIDSPAGEFASVDMTSGVTTGKTYEAHFTVSEMAAGTGMLKLGGVDSDPSAYTFTANGDYRVILKALGDFAQFKRVDTTYFKVTGISVKEIPGNHAGQAISSYRPIYQSGSGLHWLWFDGTDDKLEIPELSCATGNLPTHFFYAMHVTDTSVSANHGLLTVNPGSLDTETQRGIGFESINELKADVRNVNARYLSDFSEPKVADVRFGSGLLSAAVDGAAPTTVDAPNTNTTGTRTVIGEGLTGYHVQHKCYGILVTDRHLESDDRQGAIQYLAEKSGVTL